MDVSIHFNDRPSYILIHDGMSYEDSGADFQAVVVVQQPKAPGAQQRLPSCISCAIRASIVHVAFTPPPIFHLAKLIKLA